MKRKLIDLTIELRINDSISWICQNRFDLFDKFINGIMYNNVARSHNEIFELFDVEFFQVSDLFLTPSFQINLNFFLRVDHCTIHRAQFYDEVVKY